MCATNQVKGNNTTQDKHKNSIDPNRKENAYSEPPESQTHTDYLYEHLIEGKDLARPVKQDFR